MDANGFYIVQHPSCLAYVRNKDEFFIRGKYTFLQFLHYDLLLNSNVLLRYRSEFIHFREVTKFEMLPALLTARRQGLLCAPEAVLRLLDIELGLLKLSPCVNLPVTVAGGLLHLVTCAAITIEQMPAFDKLFPVLFSKIVTCDGCETDMFTDYYRPFTTTTHSIGYKLLDWCLDSFVWRGVMRIPKEKFPLHEPPLKELQLAFPKTKAATVTVLIIYSVEDELLIEVQDELEVVIEGHGIPENTTGFTNHVLEKVSERIRVNLLPGDDTVLPFSCKFGSVMWDRYGSLFHRRPCAECCVAPKHKRESYMRFV